MWKHTVYLFPKLLHWKRLHVTVPKLMDAVTCIYNMSLCHVVCTVDTPGLAKKASQRLYSPRKMFLSAVFALGFHICHICTAVFISHLHIFLSYSSSMFGYVTVAKKKFFFSFFFITGSESVESASTGTHCSKLNAPDSCQTLPR